MGKNIEKCSNVFLYFFFWLKIDTNQMRHCRQIHVTNYYDGIEKNVKFCWFQDFYVFNLLFATIYNRWNDFVFYFPPDNIPIEINRYLRFKYFYSWNSKRCVYHKTIPQIARKLFHTVNGSESIKALANKQNRNQQQKLKTSSIRI